MDMVDVTKFVGDTSLNNESFVDLMTLSNINHGANLRLPLDTQNAERPSPSGEPRAPDLEPGALPPGRPLEALPSDPRYRLALRACHGIQLSPKR